MEIFTKNILFPVTLFLAYSVCGYFVANKIFNYVDSKIKLKVTSVIAQEKIKSMPKQYVEIQDILQDIKYNDLKTGLLSNMARIEIKPIVDNPTFRFIIYKDIYIKIKDNNGSIKFCNVFDKDGKEISIS